ncbi:MAG: type restriction enzyme terminus family protein [Phycisphaerales bacterium]|nr:type restriction enzyme terminus family protein [Phycisphaerales bacterium]
MAITNKVRDRLVTALKRLIPIVQQQRAKDVSEADTVTLVKDLLAEAFGYDKYAELTSEHAIRGTYCDLAVKIDEKLVQLVEVKSAGSALDDRHVKQAVDYASNQGVEWVILTNACVWRIYHVIFAKPIDKRLVVEIDITSVNLKAEADLERLYLLTKEGFVKGAHAELRDRQDAASRYLLAALLMHNDSVVATIRRELRRMVDVLVSDDEILQVLAAEVIKRDTLEGPMAEEAAKRVNKAEPKPRERKVTTSVTAAPQVEEQPAAAVDEGVAGAE